jgi:hypothetical protein
MDAKQWIAEFAAAAGAEPPSEADVESILALAAVAAHSSERIAAPIACWIASGTGLEPERARELAERVAPSDSS